MGWDLELFWRKRRPNSVYFSSTLMKIVVNSFHQGFTLSKIGHYCSIILWRYLNSYLPALSMPMYCHLFGSLSSVESVLEYPTMATGLRVPSLEASVRRTSTVSDQPVLIDVGQCSV